MMLIYHVLPSYMLEYEKYEQFWAFGVGGDFSNRGGGGGGGSCGTFLLFYTKQVQNLSFSMEAPLGKMK